VAPPVFHIEPSQHPDAGGELTVTGDEARHAAQVARIRAGEPIHLVDGEGRRLEGVVTASARNALVVSVDRVITEPEPMPRIVVIQALAKGDRGELAVAAMTEVGVDVIVPWSAEHCVVRWDGERARRGVAKLQSTARAAAKQARRARVPRVEGLHTTDQLAPWIAGAALAIGLDESATDPLAGFDIPAAGDVTLIVGPEGGLSEVERVRLADLGAHLARLGPTVLRTSTAGPVAAGIVLARTARWGVGHVRMSP